MMRSNPFTSMQKTYDECFLQCSTAVYFENNGNETEALRSWKSALDQIYYHNAYRLPANYRARTQTEKALQDSLKELELQCKERVDLLEALKQSRDEDTKDKAEAAPASGSAPRLSVSGASEAITDTTNPYFVKKTEPVRPAVTSTPSTAGWLGGGTIPPVDYGSLAHPPPLPQRPSLGSKLSTNGEAQRSQSYINKSSELLPLAPTESRTSQRSREPSPTKKGGMLKTLRSNSGKDGARSSSSASSMRSSMRTRPPAGAANAATLAWGVPAPKESKDSYKPPDAIDQLAIATAKVSLQAKLPETESTTSTKPLPPVKPEPLRYRSEYHIPNRIIDPHTRRIIPGALDKGAPGTTSTPSPVPGIRRKRVGEMSASTANIAPPVLTDSGEEAMTSSPEDRRARRRTSKKKQPAQDRLTPELTPSSGEDEAEEDQEGAENREWDEKCKQLMKKLPRGVDEGAAKQILNEIVIKGDEVHWPDIAGLEPAKSALKETVVYPFLRPDLFMGLREPARGMLLFGPPGTGKTMLARAVATESKSTFFAISASSLTSKFLGESEKLVRALFTLAKALAPSIIFVDEIDSLLSSRSGASEHEATRRIKTEFLIQWSDLAKAAAGRETSDKDKERGDASRVLVLAATNLPWAIDEAARRRFVRRQYIPLPEDHVRETQLKNLLSHQKHSLRRHDIKELVHLTQGFSGSDITALAKDAAMGPLRSLGEKLLSMSTDEIRPIGFEDFEASLVSIRPSVSGKGLKEYEDWAREFGERGG